MNLFNDYQTLKAYRSDPLGFVKKIHQEKGHRAYLKLFGKELFIISHPQDVLHVLKTNPEGYTKGRTTKALRQFLGNGLITNEGASWRKQYRLIRPIMNLKSVYQLAPKMLETTLSFMPELGTEKKVDTLREMNRLTWRIVLKTLFSLEVSKELDDWLDDVLEMMRIITSKTRSSVPIPFWVPTPQNKRMKDIVRKFDQTVYRLIEERRSGVRKEDFLQLLVDAREEGTSQMSDLEIRDEIMTFMMAGHETITNSMTWTVMELARNPHYQEKLFSEAKAFFEDRNFENLQSSPWLTAVVDEALRLWPPVWVFMRQAEKTDQLDGLMIPPKANVVLAPILSHRSADFWQNPEAFWPERFLPENRKSIVPGSFYPFGLGPRSCIGSLFAGLEAKIILASLIYHYSWSVEKFEEQKTEAGISLRPVNNIFMTFRGRR